MEVIQEKLTDEMRKTILNGFKNHAVQAIGFHDAHPPQAFYSLDQNDNFKGIVAASLFWGTLHINFAYVDERYRGQNIGTELMEKAFEFGKKNNCSFAFTETMSFQALNFYKKLGFAEDLVRKCPKANLSFHYLKMDL